MTGTSATGAGRGRGPFPRSSSAGAAGAAPSRPEETRSRRRRTQPLVQVADAAFPHFKRLRREIQRGGDVRGRGSFLYRRGELAVVLVLSGLAVFLMFLTNSTQAAIARSVEDLVLSPFRAVDRSVRQMRSVLAADRELAVELAAARLELARNEEFRRENERLRAMLGFEVREGFSLIGCEVLAEGAGRLGGAIVLLDRGYDHGLREGMALVGSEGLVGKVVEVRPQRAHALLLTHPDCAVSARLERSRVAGIVEWLPGSFTSLKLRNISYLADVQVGDRVISSGLGGVFPEGILVGAVSAIEKDMTGLVLDITIRPATHFRALEEIFAVESAGGVDAMEGLRGRLSLPGTAPAAKTSTAGKTTTTNKPSTNKASAASTPDKTPAAAKTPAAPSIAKTPPPIDRVPPQDRAPAEDRAAPDSSRPEAASRPDSASRSNFSSWPDSSSRPGAGEGATEEPSTP